MNGENLMNMKVKWTK